ncbi:DUF1266 domain-containing protein [Paenibacillus sp. SYP-B3998]|uniref:DUF1266 domain-containing protein n=1 Tax=Paenibacillus sp. SYP-B3998 TaxID=2678564 RepID=A0A6G4A605_9BACL|nr:DUF1266 domain-containing protein [Paenibacillus sp. SYP-B3998]NEW09903.1 DUF1266 domain-containing protein [Paenibacillus sp. SYP-B3998]
MSTLRGKELKKLKLYMRSLSAVCLKGNLAYYFTLYAYGGLREKFVGRRLITSTLEEGWRIGDAQSLKHNLGWLLEGGSRHEFNKMRYLLSALSDADRVKYIESQSKENESYAKLCIVNYYMNKLPADGIAAFDYAWYIYLCRAGRTLGYLSEHESQQRMIYVAQRIQQSYSGWNEYIAAYVCGGQFVAKDNTFAFAKKNEAYLTKLFAAERSPLRQLDWDMQLPTLSRI